jgi:methionyl-tRNA synthetase
MKVLKASEKNNSSVSKYCDDISSNYAQLFKKSDIDFSDFVRTTEERHKKAVTKFWETLNSQNAIYKAKYAGYYCLSDETFLTASQLNTDEKGNKFSLESSHPAEWIEEENYMFKLNEFQEDVLYWAKQENRVVPKKFNKILLDMLSQESLPNISISRPSARMQWGIPVPNDPSQNIYVWLDALTNYLTVAGYPERIKLWPPNLQVIGKDILKFHGIYWPAFLIAANMEPPNQLLVHSHWTIDGQKMSKSKKNVIDPMERALTYTMEGFRYFLLREGVQHSDGSKFLCIFYFLKCH